MRNTKTDRAWLGPWVDWAAAAALILSVPLAAAPLRAEVSPTATTVYSACDGELRLYEMLAVEPLAQVPADLDALVMSPNNRLAYGTSLGSNKIWVLAMDKTPVELSVPDWSHRRLTVRWVNDKLLYLETVFSDPNAGAYWVLDLDDLSLVTCGGWITHFDSRR